jgi:hypothetical protein
MRSNYLLYIFRIYLVFLYFFPLKAQKLYPDYKNYLKPYYYKKLEGIIEGKEIYVILYYNNEYFYGNYIKGYLIENNQIKKDLYLTTISSDELTLEFEEFFPSKNLTPKTQHKVQKAQIKLSLDKKLNLYKGHRIDFSKKLQKIILREIQPKNPIKFDYKYLSQIVKKRKKSSTFS